MSIPKRTAKKSPPRPPKPTTTPWTAPWSWPKTKNPPTIPRAAPTRCACTCARWAFRALLDRDGEVVIAKKIEMGEQDVLYALVEVPVAVEELINVGEDLRQNRIKLKDVVKTIEEDDPSEDELNQRSRVILLLDEIKQIFKKKRKIYKKLDDCNTLDRKVTAIQKEIISYKEEIVTRLRDIKLEKTLIDRIIETVEDYVRQMHNCQRDLSAYILSTGRTQAEIQEMFTGLEQRTINPNDAARDLKLSVDELFSFKEMIIGKIEILSRLQEKCCHNVNDLEEVLWRISWQHRRHAPKRGSSAQQLRLVVSIAKKYTNRGLRFWTSSRERQHRPRRRPWTRFSTIASTSSPPTPPGGSVRPSPAPSRTRPAPSVSRCT